MKDKTWTERLLRKRSLINLLVGMVIGFGLTSQMRSLSYEWKRRPSSSCSFQTQENTRKEVESNFKYSSLTATVDRLQRNQDPENGLNYGRSLLFVGVMTAQKFLDSRALSIHRTWGQKVPGKFAFFTSSSSRSEYGLPLVPLPTVDDSYPPQKKSFLMLKFIHDHFIDKFDWFMRADDDVYINTEKLEAFLRTVDANKAHFIGQAGVGNKEEFGQLNLEPDENFCMGGPGLLLSRAALKMLAPNIQYCLKHLYSTHEDVEVGRCVRKFVGIPCTWAYEMQTIFYHNFSGEISSSNPITRKVISNAITLHPIKISSTMYKLHNAFMRHKHRNLRLTVTQLHREIQETKIDLKSETELPVEFDLKLDPFLYGNSSTLGQPLALAYPETTTFTDREMTHWDFITRSMYSATDLNPKKHIEPQVKTALDNNVIDIMASINKFSKQRGRIIDYKSLYYGYIRTKKCQSVEYILDLLMVYKRYRGRKLTLPVRRHAYALQTFSKPEIREVPATSGDEMVNMVVPLSGRIEPFKRFVRNFIEVQAQDPKVTLAIVLFPDAASSRAELKETKEIINDMLHSGIALRFAQLGGHFSRAAALQRGAALFNKEALLFFVDVDMHFTAAVIARVRMNTRKSVQVYYPIVFSQHSPQFATEQSLKELNITTESGYWRQFGFGIASLYNSDLQAVGGMNIAIQGWGKEDVDLFNKFIRSNLTIFRASDPQLIHIHHEIHCNPSLTQSQYDMCIGTKLNSLGSVRALAKYIIKNRLAV